MGLWAAPIRRGCAGEPSRLPEEGSLSLADACLREPLGTHMLAPSRPSTPQGHAADAWDLLSTLSFSCAPTEAARLALMASVRADAWAQASHGCASRRRPGWRLRGGPMS